MHVQNMLDALWNPQSTVTVFHLIINFFFMFAAGSAQRVQMAQLWSYDNRCTQWLTRLLLRYNMFTQLQIGVKNLTGISLEKSNFETRKVPIKILLLIYILI